MVITNSNHKIRAFTDFVSTCDKNRVNEACAHLGSEPEIMNTCLDRGHEEDEGAHSAEGVACEESNKYRMPKQLENRDPHELT